MPKCIECENYIDERCSRFLHGEKPYAPTEDIHCSGFKLKDTIQTDKMHDSGKPTNPKDALGIKKVPLHCIPCGPLFELGLAMMEGGRKYGTHNYRAIGTRTSTYYNAAMRHLIDWWEGEDIDPDSGIHHIIKAIASLFVVRDSMLMGNFEDDRPLKYPDGLNMSQYNGQAAALIEKYPNCVKPFIEKSKDKL